MKAVRPKFRIPNALHTKHFGRLIPPWDRGRIYFRLYDRRCRTTQKDAPYGEPQQTARQYDPKADRPVRNRIQLHKHRNIGHSNNDDSDYPHENHYNIRRICKKRQPFARLSLSRSRTDGYSSKEWITTPERSFGSNHVVLGGMILPVSAMLMSCCIETG